VLRNRHLTVIASGVALLVGILAGCQSAGEFRQEADEVAYEIIDEKQRQGLGRTEPFTIETAGETLRQRLLSAQGLVYSHPASLGADQLEAIAHWPDDDYLQRERPTEGLTADMRIPPEQPVTLTLTESLQVAAANSRNYQSEKESVFRSALDLDLERDAFRATFAGLIGSRVEHDAEEFDAGDGVSGPTTGVETTGEFSVEQRFKSGLTIAGRLVIDLARLLSDTEEASVGLLTDVTVSLPLLAGSGEHIVAEPLTQAERNVLYALWEFERFKRSFVVNVASDYLAVLQQIDRVENAEGNYRRLIDSLQRARALNEAGRLPEIDIDQARQDVLRARDGWIQARESYLRQLDQFKLTLGLPTDARIELDPGDLERLAETAAQSLGGGAAGAAEVAAEAEGYERTAEGEIRLMPPSRENAGPLELPEDRAVRLALANRLDLRVAQHEVNDAMRGVMVAGDALRPGLLLTATGAAGERRGIGSATASDAQLRFERGQYGLGLDLDLPWEKTAERNAYRNALIGLEQTVRGVQELEDNVKLDIRNALRDLQQARISYQIQREAVAVAEKRVDSVNMFLRFGRAEIRDLLEAERDLLDAQNNLTDALVNYRVTELEFQRDLGLLQVDEKGIWREYDPGADDES